MKHERFDDVLYEISCISLAHEPGYGVELTQMSEDGGGVATALVRGASIATVHQSPMPVDLYVWWSEAVAEVARYEHEGGGEGLATSGDGQ